MEEYQESFDALKALCISIPDLAFADFMKPFKLHMDARTTELGTVLYQEQDRTNQVIGYASRALSKSEFHWPAQ